MSLITTAKANAAVPGETISSVKVNAVYAEIATATASIGPENTRTESISRRHLVDLGTNPLDIKPTFHQIQTTFQSATTLTYNNTAYADISHGGGCIINFVVPLVLRPGEVLRLQANVNMTACTKGVDSGLNLALSTDNYYFRFFGDPNGVSSAISPEFGYSLLSNSGSTTATYQAINQSYSDKIQSQLVVQQREGFSYVYINKTGANITFTNVRVKVRVDTPLGLATANTISLKEFRIVAIGGR
jgi:hypothetical protein